MSVQASLLALVTAQRLFELVLSARNTRRLRAKGAVEFGARHYPYIVALHAVWLLGLWALALPQPIVWPWLVVFLAAQVLRIWTLRSLGDRWTTRILVLPGAPLVRRGPYRFLRHPNYLVVVVEIATLPMAFGLLLYAVLFSALNAWALSVRIRREEEALRTATDQVA